MGREIKKKKKITLKDPFSSGGSLGVAGWSVPTQK